MVECFDENIQEIYINKHKKKDVVKEQAWIKIGYYHISIKYMNDCMWYTFSSLLKTATGHHHLFACYLVLVCSLQFYVVWSELNKILCLLLNCWNWTAWAATSHETRSTTWVYFGKFLVQDLMFSQQWRFPWTIFF